MKAAAANLEFEEAARLRDEIRRMEAAELGLLSPGVPASLAQKHGFPAGTPGAPIKKRGKTPLKTHNPWACSAILFSPITKIIVKPRRIGCGFTQVGQKCHAFETKLEIFH